MPGTCDKCGQALAGGRCPDWCDVDNVCRYCGRYIEQDTDGGPWIDPEAGGDDAVWREVCDAHDTFTAEHAPVPTACECCGDAIDPNGECPCDWGWTDCQTSHPRTVDDGCGHE